MLEEFKKFALKGNVIDMAVGVIIGGAFSKIVTSLVNDIIMPVMGFFTGRIDLSSLKWIIRPGVEGTAELAIKYGQFLQSSIDFLIIAWSIFFAVRILNHFRHKEAAKDATPPAPPAPPKPSKEELLLTEIRDLLKRQRDVA